MTGSWEGGLQGAKGWERDDGRRKGDGKWNCHVACNNNGTGETQSEPVKRRGGACSEQVKARYPAEKEGAGCDLRPDFDLPEPPLEYCEARKPSEEVSILI